MILETFMGLLTDPAHWYFELLLIFIFDVVIGMAIWPFIDSHLHAGDTTEHEHIEALEEVVGGLLMRIRTLEGEEDA